MKKILIAIFAVVTIVWIAIRVYPYRLTLASDFDQKGIDISHYNNVYNFSKLNGKYKFCIMKATEGKSLKDSKFKTFWSLSKKNGLIRGAYHFYRPGVSPDEQFKNFKNTVKLEKGDLPPFLDVEKENINVKDVNRWIKLCESHYGVKPIVYCSICYFYKHLFGRLDKCQMWIASVNYGEKLKPNLISYKCVFWQWSQHSSKVDGIRGEVDEDYFLGNENEFTEILMK